MMDHSKCDHPRTPAGRSKCRRASTPSTASPAHRATPRVLDDGEEKRPADKARCCYNCALRQIEWFGTVPLTGQRIWTCDKCKYLIIHAHDLKAVEV